jgi:3-oxoacyl-(acyl-carrier-protein) synthase/NAD(P)-dependent dehydrogenase (short-subunit alcohol dehydrogenase family)/acyl carrier protein
VCVCVCLCVCVCVCVFVCLCVGVCVCVFVCCCCCFFFINKNSVTCIYSMPSSLLSAMHKKKRISKPIIALSKTSTNDSTNDDSIAIIGQGIRFPGSGNDTELFWKNVQEGKSFSQKNTDRFLNRNKLTENKEILYTTHNHPLDDVEYFDHQFFNISAKEAEIMDPTHKLALECAYDTFHNAGYDKKSLKKKKIGVWVGQCGDDWAYQTDQKENVYTATSKARSITSNHISYCLGLVGPSMTIDTACSSSLVAVSLGVQSLRNKEVEAALVGGVHLNLSAIPYVSLCIAQMLSKDGVCRTFDAGANGYARGEGAAFVLCKRLTDAQKAGDRILATIEGIGTNQDGKSAVLTAPNGPSQVDCYEYALHQAKIEPKDVGFIATHGTGTPLGDPIEVRGIAEVYGMGRRDKHPPLFLGAVKTNIGHTEGAAGIANLIYGLMVLRKQEIPPIGGLSEINPLVKEAIDGKMIVIPSTLVDKLVSPIEYVAASSFGFGGTNCHMIMKRYHTQTTITTSSPPPPPYRFDHRVKFPLFVDKEEEDTIHSHYQLSRIRTPIIIPEKPRKPSSYCFVSDSIDMYDAKVSNIVFVATNNNVDILIALLKRIESHQKLYTYNHTFDMNGVKGIVFAYCCDFPAQYGSYIEYDLAGMPFPFEEFDSGDFWVAYDAESKRSVVRIERAILDTTIENDLLTNQMDSKNDLVLITGATGGIGSQITKHLYDQGVRKFIVVTRSSKLSKDLLEEIPNAKITYHHIDLTSEEAVKEIFNNNPITGVYHCAGVAILDAFDDINLEAYDSKTIGALYLHRHSDKAVKDFWLCSSISSTWGVGGQYGYCYANAFMDDLALERRRQGLSVSVQHIGPVKGVGMAAGVEKEMKKIGLLPLPVKEVVESFRNNDSADIVCRFKNNTFGGHLPKHASLFSQLLLKVDEMATDQKQSVSVFNTKGEIENEIKRIFKYVVGGGGEIKADEPLMEAGIDSLSAVEFQTCLNKSFSIKFSSTVLFDYPTIKSLTQMILQHSIKTEDEYKFHYDIITKADNDDDDVVYKKEEEEGGRKRMIQVDRLVVERRGFGKVEYMGTVTLPHATFPDILNDVVIDRDTVELRGGSKFKKNGQELNSSCIVTYDQYVEVINDENKAQIVRNNLSQILRKRKILLLEYQQNFGRVRLFMKNLRS